MTPTPTAPIDETVEDVIQASSFLPESLQFWVVIAIGAVVAGILTVVFSGVARRILGRMGIPAGTVKPTRTPFFATMTSIVVKSVFSIFYRDRPWYNAWQFVILALLIFFLTWFIISVVKVIETSVLTRVEVRFGPGRKLAKVRTQVGLLRRVLTAVLCVLAIGAVLLSIEQVRALGAGILASAGGLHFNSGSDADELVDVLHGVAGRLGLQVDDHAVVARVLAGAHVGQGGRGGQGLGLGQGTPVNGCAGRGCGGGGYCYCCGRHCQHGCRRRGGDDSEFCSAHGDHRLSVVAPAGRFTWPVTLLKRRGRGKGKSLEKTERYRY